MSDTAIFENSDHAAAEPVPQLSAIEARILGSLIEKAAITPDIYPLTVNAVVQACNQKTSREPIMHLDTGEIGHALREMEAKGLVKLDPFAQRAARYTHCLDAVYGVMPRQRALLCVMLLRGPQTLSELHTRCERLADFPALDDVRDSLDRLLTREPALVVRIPRSGGQREDRYMHLLCGAVDVDAYAAAAAIHSPSFGASSELVDRVAKLEEEVAALKAQLETLIGP
ncbi:YceH family protein [Rudaea cellulosilytica]|uniref:YceH family protein n=1 Tax=Rudaea cellulosilytica TaxID=540746 RepID=UPI0003793DC1|nr:YceH family protein [Rudaea cellulosilytica]